MPRYFFECAVHGRFEINCRLTDWDDKKPCKTEGCHEIAEQVLIPSDSRNSLTPIVVHVSATGEYRFPGAADARCPEGFEKKELRTIREIESFERDVNTRLRDEAQQHQENQERCLGPVKDQLRGDLRQAMQRMSPAGRALAEFAIRRNNERKRQSTEVGFHVDILHNDQSNREAHCDARTGWKRKYF